jgi:hypothetical protein
VNEHGSCKVWDFLGEFWWIFGVFRGACDLFVNIFQKLRALL